jgi:hypothetical protein
MPFGSAEHDRLVAVDQDTVRGVIPDGAGQHPCLDPAPDGDKRVAVMAWSTRPVSCSMTGPSDRTLIKITAIDGPSRQCLLWIGRSARSGRHDQRSAAVWTGASQSASISRSVRVTVIEQPAISSAVT